MKKKNILKNLTSQLKNLKGFVVGLTLGLALVAGSVFAWNAVWHNPSWIQSGQTISASLLGESLQYLFEHSVPKNFPACTGSNKALQWNGTQIICGTIVASSTTTTPAEKTCSYNGRTYQNGENYYTGESDPMNSDPCYDCATTMIHTCVNGVWITTNGGTSCSYNVGLCSCFTSSSQVAMADGSTKSISAVVPGDKVQGKDGINTVLGIETPPLAGRALYRLNGKDLYFFTREHPFLTKDGWKSINPNATLREEPETAAKLNLTPLKVGDVLITKDGEVKVKSIEKKTDNKEQKVYNLILDGDHTYIINGFVVHNKM